MGRAIKTKSPSYRAERERERERMREGERCWLNEMKNQVIETEIKIEMHVRY